MARCDVRLLDTSNVTGMRFMFAGGGRLASLDASGWDTSNVADMQCMFYGCRSLASLNLSGRSLDGAVVDHMFAGCTLLHGAVGR